MIEPRDEAAIGEPGVVTRLVEPVADQHLVEKTLPVLVVRSVAIVWPRAALHVLAQGVDRLQAGVDLRRLAAEIRDDGLANVAAKPGRMRGIRRLPIGTRPAPRRRLFRRLRRHITPLETSAHRIGSSARYAKAACSTATPEPDYSCIIPYLKRWRYPSPP